MLHWAALTFLMISSSAVVGRLMPMPELPSEEQIERALHALGSDHGKWQRLAEAYAQLVEYERFARLVPFGRNANDETNSNWPDAFAVGQDGRIDVLEATHWDSKWRTELGRILEKCEARRGKVLGLFFVTYDLHPGEAKLEAFYSRAASAGLASAQVTLVFRNQLRRDLREPRFARVREELLGLAQRSWPFQSLRRSLFRQPHHQAAAFVPTEEEHVAGALHRAAVLEKVDQRLSAVGWAEVRGRGAAGKTVLAAQVGWDHSPSWPSRTPHSFPPRPAYYLDLGRLSEDQLQLMIDDGPAAIAGLADAATLFVVDNVHLDEDLARDLLLAWQDCGRGSRLLLLGRENTARPNVSQLVQSDATPLVLRAGQDELLGVFRRLMLRSLRAESIPHPTQTVVRDWLATFGGDLVAFAAAVSGRKRELGRGDLRLTASDAASFVHHRYLSHLESQETHDLVRLAALAPLELDVPAPFFGPNPLSRSLRSGVVIRRGDFGHPRATYTLIHPGVGALLLAASTPSPDLAETLNELAEASPTTATLVAARLLSAGRRNEAVELLKRVVSLPGGAAAHVAASGFRAPRAVRRLVDLEVATLEEFDEMLASDVEAIRTAILDAPDIASHVLRLADESLPRTLRVLGLMFADIAFLSQLAHSLVGAPLHATHALASRVEAKWPDCFRHLRAALASPRILELARGQVGMGPIPGLPQALDYCERSLPELYEVARDDLGTDALCDERAAQAIGAGPDTLAAFTKAIRRFELLHKTILDALSHPATASDVANRAIEMPPHFLPSVLRFGQEESGSLLVCLATLLADAAICEQVARRAAAGRTFYPTSLLAIASSDFPTLARALAANTPRSVSPAPGSSRTPLMESADSTPALIHDLRTLKTKDIPSACDEIVQRLLDPAHRDCLLGSVVALPPNLIRLVLELSLEVLPQEGRVFVEYFVSPEGSERLAASVVESSLDHLGGFVSFVNEELPDLAAQLTRALSRPAAQRRLLIRTYRATPSGLLSFLRCGPVADAVVAEIDVERWASHWSARPVEQPTFMTGIARELGRLGRTELAKPLAQSVLRSSTREQWSEVGLDQLGQVLRLGADDAEAAGNFLDRAITADWLRAQYWAVWAGVLAAFLYGAWSAHPEGVLDRLAIPGLLDRVQREFADQPQTPNDVSGALQLLGAASLVGVRPNVPQATLPSDDAVVRALWHSRPRSNRLSHVNVQVWLGLREIVGLKRVCLQVPVKIGQEMLELFRNAEPPAEHQQTLNHEIIAWLARADAAGWLIEPSFTRFGA